MAFPPGCDEFRPMWRERELIARPPPTFCAPPTTKGQLPTPSETTAEPSWRLHGVHYDKEAEAELERRMEVIEAERLVLQEEEDMILREEAQMLAQEKAERKRRELELLESEDGDGEERERDQEDFVDEVEAAVRELRAAAMEQALRDVENEMHTLHVTSLKVVDAEAREAEEMYMRGVEQEQELEQEEMEERRGEELLRRQDEEERLMIEAKEAQATEAMAVRRRERKLAAQEEAHENAVGGGMYVSTEMEAAVRREEQIEWDADRSEIAESTEGAAARTWGGLRKAAEKKYEELTRELQERHGMFADRLRKKIEMLHVEGERLRREEWAKGGMDFSASQVYFDSAAIIRDNFEEHVSMLDEEYRGIAERKDIWPPEETRNVKHPLSAGLQRSPEKSTNTSAAHERVEHVPQQRPSTAPRRMKSAKDRDRLIRQGRSIAPTGFSHGIRAIFESLDKERKGYISADSVPESFQLLGLDIDRKDLVDLLGGSGKVDYEKLEELVLESIGDNIATPRSFGTARSR